MPSFSRSFRGSEQAMARTAHARATRARAHTKVRRIEGRWYGRVVAQSITLLRLRYLAVDGRRVPRGAHRAGSWFRVQGSGFMVPGSGFLVRGLGSWFPIPGS